MKIIDYISLIKPEGIETEKSKQLAEDVLFLVQSLGGKGIIKNRITKYIYKGIKKKKSRIYIGIFSFFQQVAILNLVGTEGIEPTTYSV